MDGYAFPGGYNDCQSYEGNRYDGYRSPCTTQALPPSNYYDTQSQYFHPPQFHPQNSYSQYTPNYQTPYPPQPYQDSFYFSQSSHQIFFPQPSQDFYQEPQQECQPIDEEMRSMMNSIIIQMNMLQVQLDDLKAQRKGLTTQDPIESSFPYEGVIHELFTPSEGDNEERSEGEDDDDEKVDEESEMESLNGEKGVELQVNGVEEETKDESVEEEREENMEFGDKGHIARCPVDAHSFSNFEVVNMSSREFMEDRHSKCFLEGHMGADRIEEDSIFLEVDHCKFFEENMLILSLREFLNARHLRTFIEEKVDGEKGLIFIQSCMDSSLRLSRASDVKLSASWEAPHVILYFLAFYFIAFTSCSFCFSSFSFLLVSCWVSYSPLFVLYFVHRGRCPDSSVGGCCSIFGSQNKLFC